MANIANLRWLVGLVLLASCSSTNPDGPGRFEGAGASIDRTVEKVGEKSEEIAQKTVIGSKKVAEKVAGAVENAAQWVKEKVADSPAVEATQAPTTSPTPETPY